MYLNSITISNCKSFRFPETITFDREFTILVGPNGGGKSNTLDILTIVLRRFFFPAYRIIERVETGRRYREIQKVDHFSNLTDFLDVHLYSDSGETRITLKLVVGKSDCENIASIFSNRSALESAAGRFRSISIEKNLSNLNSWTPDEIKEGQQFEFVIVNGNFQPTERSNDLLPRKCTN